MMEKISWTDRVRNAGNITWRQGGEEYCAYNQKKK
jgi:hypothetical protein